MEAGREVEREEEGDERLLDLLGGTMTGGKKREER